MEGIIPFTDLMRNIEREEIKQELLREWYQQRSVSTTKIKPVRNN